MVLSCSAPKIEPKYKMVKAGHIQQCPKLQKESAEILILKIGKNATEQVDLQGIKNGYFKKEIEFTISVLYRESVLVLSRTYMMSLQGLSLTSTKHGGM